MVAQHELLIDGVTIEAPNGTFPTAQIGAPVVLTMRDDDFPGRFLQDLASRGQPHHVSSASAPNLEKDKLFQPVQRMLHVAMVQVACNSLGYPRLNPTRVVSAGVVIRRVHGDEMQAWMRSPRGLFEWNRLTSETADEDPDPARRPAHPSGQTTLDQKLAALQMASAWTESTTPAFVAPPATCESLERTIVYGIVPTASSEMSGAPVTAPAYNADELAKNLPTLLQAGKHSAPLPGEKIDYRWMSDDFLNAKYPSKSTTPKPAETKQKPDPHAAESAPEVTPPKPDPRVAQFQVFSTALRLLKTTFDAFDASSDSGKRIMGALNKHVVTVDGNKRAMGEFYSDAAAKLLDYDPNSGPVPTITLPTSWDPLVGYDIALLITSLRARSKLMLMPEGRFQDAASRYRLRVFLRVKSEHPNCPPKLVWSAYSPQFQIAQWFESSGRPHVPVTLPDPTDRSFLKNVKPDCSFAVPKGLMSAMQGSTMSGLMNGAAGGQKMTIDWLCSFSIPLITICAFFVLNIFLSLLNIVFFWMAFIKICIPIPSKK
jgi:hypothetical protein